MMPEKYWKPLNTGWWVTWALENQRRYHPNSKLMVYSDEFKNYVTGYIPMDWNGETIVFSIKNNGR